MRRFIYIVVVVLLLGVVGCNEKQPVQAPKNALTVANDCSVVRLHSGQGASFEVTFTAKNDWHITTSGQAFEASPMRGKGSSEPQTITITTLSPNMSKVALMRGKLNICLDGYSTKYEIKVMQCAATERTHLVWFFGTSLSYYFKINIDCMKQAVAGDILGKDRLILFVQSSRNKGAIKEIYFDSTRRTAEEMVICEVELPETLTGKELGEYLCEMMEIAPAERYAMIVGGHSTAWLPVIPSSGGVPLKVGGYRPDWSVAEGAEVTRTIGESNVKLNIEDFAEGLEATNQHFDWLYFDVCFMSSIEASYALRNSTDYVVGSPCEIMGYGSPFDLLLDELVADDLEGACRTYRDYYANDYYGSKSGCIATIVCEELDALAATVKSVNRLPVMNNLDILKVQTYEGRSAHIFFDIEDYMMNAYGDVAEVTAFRSQLDKAIINRFHTEKFYSTYNAQLNDINHYSGVNFTPDDSCVAVLETQATALLNEKNTKQTELEALKDELIGTGVTPDSSERYNALNHQVQELTREWVALREQVDELNYYHPSLKNTEWYRATH